MAESRTPIQVPPRREGEAPATPEQLQAIREMVTGMSLSGYRFDYRKMGTDQAGSVIDQLMRMRDRSSVRQSTSSGRGCVSSLARGATFLVFAAVVLAGVSFGGYLIYNKINESPAESDQTTAEADGEQADAEGQGGKRNPGKSDRFFGLDVADDEPGQANDEHRSDGPTPGTVGPGPSVAPGTPTPGPDTSAPVLSRQISTLNKLLVQLSQNTRKQEIDAGSRAIASRNMLSAVDKMPAVIDALDSRWPGIKLQIRSLIRQSAEPAFDGEAMREQIILIRKNLETLQDNP